MMKSKSPKQQERQLLKKRLLYALQLLSPPLERYNHCPPQTEWPSTRQLADPLDISIYKARIILLDMVKEGEVVVSTQPINNSLRWYPSHREK